MVWLCINFFFLAVVLSPLHLLSQVWGLVCSLSVGERLGCCLISVAGQESPYLRLNWRICSAIAVMHCHPSFVMWLACHICPLHDLICRSYFRIEEVWKLVLLNTNSRLHYCCHFSVPWKHNLFPVFPGSLATKTSWSRILLLLFIMFDNYYLMKHHWFNRSLTEETFKWGTEYEKPLEKHGM